MDVDQFFKAAFRVSIRAIACASSIIPKLFRDFSGMNFIMATIIGSASSMAIGALLEACLLISAMIGAVFGFSISSPMAVSPPTTMGTTFFVEKVISVQAVMLSDASPSRIW